MSENLNTDIVDESSIFGSPGGLPSSQGGLGGSGYAPRALPPSSSAPFNPGSYTPNYSNPLGNSRPPNNPSSNSAFPSPVNPSPPGPGRMRNFPDGTPNNSSNDFRWRPSIDHPSHPDFGRPRANINSDQPGALAPRNLIPNSQAPGGGASSPRPPAGTNINNPYRGPTSPGGSNSPGSGLGSNPGGSFRGNAPGGGNNNSPGSPGRYGNNPPDFSQNPPIAPPGQYRPGGGAPIGENPGGPPTFGPSNFDNYFNDFFDNFYGGQNEPPSPPPFQGGQVPGQLYAVHGTFERVSEYYQGKQYTIIEGFSFYAVGPLKGFKVGTYNGEKRWYFDTGQGPMWYMFGNGLPAYFPNGYSHSPTYQVVSFTIVKIIPIDPPPGFIDQDPPPTTPGTQSPPNTNFPPPMLLGLDPLTNLSGTDPFTGLDPLLAPALSPGTQSPPAIDPTQHPDTYKPPLPDFFPGFKPLPSGLAPPSNSPYGSAGNQNAGASSTRDPFGNRSYGYPSTSAPPTTQVNPSPNVPDTVTNPLTGTQTPVTQTSPNPDPLAPNPSTVNPHDCENPTDPCEKNRKDQLNRIEQNTLNNNNLPTPIQGTIQTERCNEIRKNPPNPNDPDTQSFSYSGVNFLGISNQIMALSKQVEAIRKDFCHLDSNLAIPDSWNLKTQPNRPQLVVIYAEVTYQQGQQKLGKSRWSFTIPHFDEAKKNNLNLPEYRKGDWMAIAELKDGSKIIINAVNEATAKRICKLALSYVSSSTRIDPKEIKITPRKGKISPKLITPVLAHYYPQGRGLTLEGELKPAWTIQLKKKEND